LPASPEVCSGRRLCVSAAASYALAVVLNLAEVDGEDQLEILSSLLLFLAVAALVLETISFEPRRPETADARRH
jgi:hypothetical protein